MTEYETEAVAVDDREHLFREYIALADQQRDLHTTAKSAMKKAEEIGQKLNSARIRLADALGLPSGEN